MATASRPTRMQKRTEFEVQEIKKGVLGGLISWWEMVVKDEVGNDLIIQSDYKIRDIYINGHKIKWTED